MTTDHLGDFSNREDYPLLREFLGQLVRTNPYSQYRVHAVGIGDKIVAGTPSRQLALRFYVSCKEPLAQLPGERRIPSSFRTFSQERGEDVEFATDVIEQPLPHLSMPDPEDELRPVPGGVSGSSIAAGGTGTIGGWVWDNTDDTIVMLSNQHVFGDTIGSPIIQPGTSDGGVLALHRIGQVKRSVPLIANFIPQTPAQCVNFVDAAIGEADSSEFFDLTVLEIGPAVYDTANPLLGDSVEKFGQTTDHTFGVITDADYALQTEYAEGTVVICDCFLVEAANPAQLWQSFGDSGAIVFRQDEDTVLKPALGLNFAGGGTPPNNYGIACKINNVFAELDLGPLCIAGCEAWVDAISGQAAEEGAIPPTFTARERRLARAQLLQGGLAADLRRRLKSSQRGRGILKFVERNRSELLLLAVKDGDFRRSATAVMAPFLRGAVTTDDIFSIVVTGDDFGRWERMTAVLERKGSSRLQKSLKPLRDLLKDAQGKTLAEIL